MPWSAKDAERHSSAANTKELQHLWATVANHALEEYHDDGKAVAIANAAVNDKKKKKSFFDNLRALLKGPPEVKGMWTVSMLANAFDTLRDIQRGLLEEAQGEKDSKDTQFAQRAGNIAADIAQLLIDKSAHEKMESRTLTDIADRPLGLEPTSRPF